MMHTVCALNWGEELSERLRIKDLRTVTTRDSVESGRERDGCDVSRRSAEIGCFQLLHLAFSSHSRHLQCRQIRSDVVDKINC